ncbi:MAG: MarR family transcriptional regulator [Rhodospirillales bacterium]|nr:MarR family transcriptional regulator [Rhodospirillales bacterium]
MNTTIQHAEKRAASPALTPEADADSRITLGVLNAVDESSAVTQRVLARDLGIALGLANAYIKRCIGKGLIKVSQAPARRYVYYLTPQGFAEKSRLTAQYLSYSFDFFRLARTQCREAFEACAARGWHRILLCGGGELAEIAALYATSSGVTLIGILEIAPPPAGRQQSLDLASFGEIDAVIVTDHRAPQAVYDLLVRELGSERVFAPRLLNVSRQARRDTA